MRICQYFEIFPPELGRTGAGLRVRLASPRSRDAVCTSVVQRARR
jgi:hypothetical protein